MNILRRLLQKTYKSDTINKMYRDLVDQARSSAFYEKHQVPDTKDGRFELLILHMILLLEPFEKSSNKKDLQMGQDLFDLMVLDLDQSVRMAGAGDIKAGRTMTKVGEAFFGRKKAYTQAFHSPDSTQIQKVLRRNLFGTVTSDDGEQEKRLHDAVSWFATYITQSRERLREFSSEDKLSPQIPWPKV